jgi:4-amino-4-deoxy-L-arabinose transferase-like glycosyltransferase
MASSAHPDRAATWAGWIALAAVLALVVVLIAPTMATVVHQPQADEGYYLAYSRALAEHGWGAFPGLFRAWLGNQSNWIFPPPSRVAFMVVGAQWSKLGQTHGDVQAQLVHASWLSLFAHLATVAIVFAFVRRNVGQLQALLVAALVAFSPLYLGLSRLALTDSFITLWQVASLAAFYELVREPRSRLWSALFVLAFTLAILSKEISLLLGFAFVAFALIERFWAKRPIVLWKLALLLAAPVVLSVVVWLAAAGSFGVLRDTLKIVLASPATNKYALQYGAGPWYRYIVDELLASPWPVALGLLGVAVAVETWRRGEYHALLVYAVVLYVAQVAVLSFFTKNLRYVAVLEVPLRMLVVALLWGALGAARWRVAKAAAVGLVVLLCWADYASYRLLFVERATYDPMSTTLLLARDMLPRPANPDGH